MTTDIYYKNVMRDKLRRWSVLCVVCVLVFVGQTDGQRANGRVRYVLFKKI